MKIGRILGIHLTMLVFVSACASMQVERTIAVPSDALAKKVSTSTAQMVGEVPEQLNFTGETIGGVEFDGAVLAGLPTVIWFWAPWCTKCKRDALDVAQASENNPAVNFVGVASQDEVSAMQQFALKYGINHFPNVADTDSSVCNRFGVSYQPAYAFISPDGAIDMVLESLDPQRLQTHIDALAS